MGGEYLDHAIAKHLPVGSADRQPTSIIEPGRGLHKYPILWAVFELYPRKTECSPRT